ncbi:hypothetical protein EUGRSUZ_H03784 [Eucalyptus grandis]|uniref:Uncharacterized protein n=2 Tax=Eucalyptus grandis TaxID=71139 RepID=A0ACC3JVL8_EUCGR|nr:hypothetical protein EUGRSUZ_H03784 [Eucalyptus grandis]
MQKLKKQKIQEILDQGRHESKITEEDEDEECLKGEEDGLSGTGNTRLLTRPSCIQGKMRDYQLGGLNRLIGLYENGINGILADEMVGHGLQHLDVCSMEAGKARRCRA